MSDKPKKAVVPPPYVLSVILCDALHMDLGTKKSYLLGTFTDIGCRTFPTVHPRMCLYFELTNGRGPVEIKLVLVDAEESRDPVFEQTQTIEFPNPRAVMMVVFEMVNTTFEQEGEYRFQIHGNGELLVERRMLVRQIKESSP